MKGLKVFAVILGCAVALCALVLILGLTPGVQTWAARKVLAGQPGSGINVGRVDAGFSAADLTDVRIVQDGAVISVKRLSANYSAWDYLTKKRLNADSVVAQDIVIDLRNAGTTAGASEDASSTPGNSAKSDTPATKPGRPAPAPAKTGTFEGLLQQAKLPFDVRLANLSAQGRALLPDEKIVNFDVKGRGIESGQNGSIDWKADLADPQADAPVRAVRSSGTIGLHITTDRRIDRIALDGTIAAEGPQLPRDQIKLEARAEQTGAAGNEMYSADIGLQRGGSVESLLKANGQFSAAAREITGGWNLSVRAEQLAALLAGLGLPEFAANGAGKFTLNPATTALAANGELQASVERLEKISPELAAVGTVQLHASFDGGFADGSARLERLQLHAAGPNGQRFAEVTTVQRIAFDTATQRLTLANPQGELARIGLRSLPLAWAQPFAKDLTIASGDLSLLLAVEAEPDGSRMRARAIEPLAFRNVTVRSGEKPLLDQVTLSASPRIDYSPTAIAAELADLKMSMPGGDALTGRASANVSNLATKPRVAFSSELQAKIVSALKPYLPLDPGPLACAAAVEGRLEGDTLHLAKFSSTVNRDNGAMLATVDLQQPITANLAAKTFSLPRPEAPAARLKLGEVPLVWAQGFIADSQLSGSIKGGAIDVVLATLERITVTTVEPFIAEAISASLDGKPAVQALDFSADLTATKNGDVITYDVRRVEVKQGNLPLATLSVAGEANLGEKPMVVAKGNLDADAAALMQQPIAAPFATLARGRITSAFEANLADAIEATATLSARGLVARQNNQPLGDLEVSLNANLRANGTGTLVAPLTLTNGDRRSDLAVNAAFDNSGETLMLTARLASNQLFVADFQPLAALAPATAEPTPAKTTPTPAPRPALPPVASRSPVPTRDTEPFWAAARGKVEVDMKRVIYGQDYPINGLRGTATIAQNRISLEGLEGRLKENPFKANATVTFAAEQAKPYTLAGGAQVTNFDVGEFLRAANPKERPAIESKVSVDAKLAGNGGTIGELAKNVYGRFDLTGTQGVLRALGRKGEMVNTGSKLLGLAGALTGSDTTAAFAPITAALAELRFDTFTMQVERAADLSLKLSNIEFISPLMRATGNGRVANRPGVEATKQPMEIMFQLGTKGELAHLLSRIKALGQTTDDKGYQLLQRSFTVGGSPAEPDSSSLWKILLQLAQPALMEKGLPALQDLLNRR